MKPITQTCSVTGKKFVILEREQKFCEQMGVPLPDTCPEERIKRVMSERNARNLYYRKCDLTGKQILSQHHPDNKFPIYESTEWWSDKWDAFEYGQDFDFSRPFFEQFFELKNKVPHMATYVISGTNENSDFTNCTGYIKNCYLISEADYDEDCYFSNRIYHCKNVSDCSNCDTCELCYECIDCQNCNNLLYSQNCKQCRDSYFLEDCQSCSDCIGCVNQRQKQYMIFNVQYSKEEYEQHKKAFRLDTHSGIADLREKCEKFFVNQPHRAVYEEHNLNCTGDHLYNSKESYNCFDCKDLEDCYNCVRVAGGVKSAMNYSSWGFGAELIYMCGACGDNAYNLRFCSHCLTGVSNATYSYLCTGCSDVFGCVGLRKGKYCILNKQYSEGEYHDLVSRIIEHMKKTPLPSGQAPEWGQYFPKKYATFGYNESIAMENFPLTKEEALAQGYRWQDKDTEESSYQGPRVEVPDSLKDVSPDIVKQILTCESSGKLYKVIPQEMKLYQRLGVPVPRRCPAQRHADRYARRNTYQLFERKCTATGTDITTSYPPDSPEVVYSLDAYFKEIY